MPPERGDLNDPGVWIDFAKSDLALARVGRTPGVRLGALCYHCQQAAEKALKAVLLRHHVEFPPTHNLRDLFNLLPPPVSAPSEVKAACDLSGYAIKGRYPLDVSDASPSEYKKAVQSAERLLRWAEKAVLAGDEPGRLDLEEPRADYSARKIPSRKTSPKSRKTNKRKAKP